MRHLWVVVTGMLAATPLSPALAWGGSGHEVVGFIAESFLTPSARQQVDALLAGEPASRRSLAAVSTWADEILSQPAWRAKTATWHYVNVSIREPGYDAARDCPGSDCVVAQVEEQRHRLADRALLPAVRLEALKFLVHFAGDMHQPIHIGDNKDKGGNSTFIRFQGHTIKLHRMWDSGVLDIAAFDHRNEEDLARELAGAVTPAERSAWEQGDVLAWAGESHVIARDEVYAEFGTDAPEGGNSPSSPILVTADYADRHVATAEKRLAQAGVRLAFMLNQALP